MIKTAPIIAKSRRKICMVTAHDFPSAEIAEAAGVDLILVGDSLAMVALGMPDTHSLTLAQYTHHMDAVMRGVKKTPVIADMPINTYRTVRLARKNARMLLAHGCRGVKVEGCIPGIVRALVRAGIPVMGHIGLTPQKANAFRVQGKDAAEAARIGREARILQNAGCFSLVLECIPVRLAQRITRRLKIPTIGIGAGRYCDGHVLVYSDLIGLFDKFKPKFVRRFGAARRQQLAAVRKYVRAVRSLSYPNDNESYH